MSGFQQNEAPTVASHHLNGTASLDMEDEEINGSSFESRVFNIVMITLALCVLFITSLYSISVCYNRTRQSKRAHVYESAVTGGEPADPVSVRAVKRSTSFINPLAFFKKPETTRDNSRIYYIYSNPLPIGLKEDEEEERNMTTSKPEEQSRVSSPLSLRDYAKDPNSGLILDPPIFYLQL